VTLNLVGSTIDITLNTSPSFIIDSGQHFTLTFNSNLAGESISMPTATGNTGATYTLHSSTPGSYMNAPYKSFEYAIDGSCTNPGSCTDQSVTFAITSNTRTFNDVNDLVAEDTAGDALFAADIFFGTTGPTFVVGANGSTTPPVPEPTSYLAVLLAGFGVMAWVGQRRKSLTASR
jgi:hypothetical protein